MTCVSQVYVLMLLVGKYCDNRGKSSTAFSSVCVFLSSFCMDEIVW
jgi:hypothetical protein